MGRSRYESCQYCNSQLLRSNIYAQPNKAELVGGGLAGIEAALERMKQGKVSGIKLAVEPQETN